MHKNFKLILLIIFNSLWESLFMGPTIHCSAAWGVQKADWFNCPFSCYK